MIGYTGGEGSPTGLAAALGLGILVVSFLAPMFGVIAVIGIGTVDGFLKHASPSPVLFILKDVILAATLAGALVKAGSSVAKRAPFARAALIGTAIFIAYWATQILHPYGSFLSGLAAFRSEAAFALLVPLGAYLIDGRTRLITLGRIAIGVGLVCGFSALLQYISGDAWIGLGPGFAKASLHATTYSDTTIDAATGYATRSFRDYGTLVDPAALGLTCAYCTLAAMAALGRVKWWGVPSILALTAVSALGMFLSQSRSAIIGLAAGIVVLAVLFALHRRTRGIILIGALAVALVVPVAVALTHGTLLNRFASGRNVGLAQATRDRSEDLVMGDLSTHPFGHGAGATGAGGGLRESGDAVAVDNFYFATLYESGIPGLLCFLFVQAAILGTTLNAATRNEDMLARTIFSAAAAGQVALLVGSWFTQGAFEYAPVAQMFWLFGGAAVRYATPREAV